jgi:hypothetical protein
LEADLSQLIRVRLELLNVLDGESDSINSHACLICHFELHGSGLVL